MAKKKERWVDRTKLTALYSLPFTLVMGKWSHKIPDGAYKRLRFLCFSAFIGLLYTIGLLQNDSGRNSNLAIILDIYLMVAIVAVWLFVRLTGAYRLFFHATVIVMTTVITIDYLSPTATRSTYLLPLILIMTYFLLGRKGGLIWTFVLLAINYVFYELGKDGTLQVQVTGQSLAYASLAMGLTSAFLFIYEGVNVANEQRIAQRDRRLKAVNAELQEELLKRYELTKKLKNTLEQTTRSNQQLEETKKTLTVALDNTNKLKEQLRIEKESVEDQVELRTQQLREEQARLQASIATLELGFLMTLHDGTVITYNPALLRICELEGQVTEQTLLKTLSKKMKGSYNLETHIERCMENGRSFEASNIVMGDKYLRVLGSAIRIKGATKAIGVVLLVEDMTAAKMLERSESEFVAIASHELRTPLTIIRGNLSLIDDLYPDKKIDKELRAVIDNVQNSAARMVVIVNQFLTMTRLEQKKTVFELDAIDVSTALNDSAAALKPLADEKGLRLWVDASAKLPKVRADSSRLQEILTNLVGNAIKFTEEGQVELSAKHSGKFVVISVTDTGKGISDKNQKLLFHKFQQATDNIFTREDGRSTGLGLYISKLLVEQMGGSIELERSTPKRGSTFSFSLPTV